MADATKVARLAHYSGTVQGVGFRYTAISIARYHGVGGWVENLPDGRVEMFIEGPALDVEACLKAIRDYWGDMISDETIEPREAIGSTRFEVRR